MRITIALLFCLGFLSVSTKADSSLAHWCEGGNYTAKSAFQSNLALLLSSLSSSNATFFTDEKGSIPDKAYGLILCRGDAGPTDCRACVQNAAQDVLSICPVSKQATVWYDNCELRYADFSFFTVVDGASCMLLWNTANASDVESFVELERELLDEVTQAAAFNSTLKFATGIAINRTGSPTIYALAQCTRDLSTEGCNNCLNAIRGLYGTNLMARKGGRALGRSCNFRYESYQFFGGRPTISLDLSAPPPAPLPLPPPPPAAAASPAPNNEQGITNKGYSPSQTL